MKKIKLLNYLTIAFLVIGTLCLIANLVMIMLSISKNSKMISVYSETKMGSLTLYATTILIMLLIKGIHNIQRALAFAVKHNYFNLKTAIHLNKAGILLLIFSVLCIAFDFLNYNIEFTESFFLDLLIHLLVFSIGIALTTVSDIIKKGETIEQENLLTI